MCGIWFYLSTNKINENEYKIFYESFLKLKQRGPDYSSFTLYDEYNLIIGFHRLAINGLISNSANQPFIYENENKKILVICNGEIYNYKSLAEKYSIQLNSGSDCEILAPLYNIVGIKELLSIIDAEFAFILCDIDKKTGNISIYIARDHCGIRPLYISTSNNNFFLSSELKGLPYLTNPNYHTQHFPPRHYALFNTNTSYNDNILYNANLLYNAPVESIKILYHNYFDFINVPESIKCLDDAKVMIRENFINSVKSRLMSDAKIGCLLSGGLDSSIVASIASHYYHNTLETFCIGIDSNAPDILYAAKVAAHIGSNHHTVIIPESDWLNAIDAVIYNIESYDITTVRASTGQYLISKWIASNTDVKVLLIGDGSDELMGGYIYMSRAPTAHDFNSETIKLLNEIHQFDVLRCDRGISSNGLEARVPFLNLNFIKTYLSISSDLKYHTINNIKHIEKYLFRTSFDTNEYLPKEVLFRHKEAFSDGVSNNDKSWYKIIQSHVDKLISNEEFMQQKNNYNINQPHTKEALYYRKIFEKYFGNKDDVVKTIPHFWLPNWADNITEPSARVLSNYI